MLIDRDGSLIEIFFTGSAIGFLFAKLLPFSKSKERIIFNIFQLYFRNSSFNNSFSKNVDMILEKRNRSDQQIIARANQINVE